MSDPAAGGTGTVVKVARADDIWVGEPVPVDAGGAPVLLVNIDGTILAYRDRCAHLQVKLSQGRLDGTVLTCAAHHWTYDLSTGHGVNPRQAALEPLPVEIRDGNVYVELAPGAEPGTWVNLGRTGAGAADG